MKSITIGTDDGSIEVRTDYTTDGSRLASQDDALAANFDRFKVEDEVAYAYLDDHVVSSVKAENTTLERVAGFLQRYGETDVEFE